MMRKFKFQKVSAECIAEILYNPLNLKPGEEVWVATCEINKSRWRDRAPTTRRHTAAVLPNSRTANRTARKSWHKASEKTKPIKSEIPSSPDPNPEATRNSTEGAAEDKKQLAQRASCQEGRTPANGRLHEPLAGGSRQNEKRPIMAAGYMIFSSLESALSAGFERYDRKSDHGLVRTKTSNGLWALAIAMIRDGDSA